MVEVAAFSLKLRGGLADQHEIEGYDGYTALAAAAWTLSLVTNYVETGEIRRRGNFVGRHSVIAQPTRPGSVIARFKVLLTGDAPEVFDLPTGSASGLLYGLVQRVIHRNTGIPSDALNGETEFVIDEHGGDVEALVSATEPSLRRAHDVIGDSASTLDWIGGVSMMGQLNPDSKLYMRDSIEEGKLLKKNVSVSGFFGNSGRGLIYDFELGRNVSFSMSKSALLALGEVFSYGLDQYVKKTGNLINIEFMRLLSSDGRPKHYLIKGARPARMLTPAKLH